MVRARILALTFVLAPASLAMARDAAPNPAVKLITADQANDCTVMGVVSDSRYLGLGFQHGVRKSMEASLAKAEKSGANAAAVLSSGEVGPNYSTTLQTFKCPDNFSKQP